jgi:hypothetical protein
VSLPCSMGYSAVVVVALRAKTDITKSSSRSADARMLHVRFLRLR